MNTEVVIPSQKVSFSGYLKLTKPSIIYLLVLTAATAMFLANGFSGDISKIIFYMKQDKKNKDSKINLILLKSITKPILNKSFKENKIRLFLKNLIN